MRPGPAVCLAVVVVLAGCSGLPFVGDEGDDTAAATAISDGQVAAQAPPGVLSRQVTNPAELGRAHARAIENRSYVVTANRTIWDPNGTVRSHLAVEVAIDEARTFQATVSTAGPDAPVLLGEPPAAAVFWSNGSTYLRRLTRDGEQTFGEFEPPTTWIGTWSYWVKTVPFGGRGNLPAKFYASLFTAVPASVDGQTTRRNTTYFRLVNDRERPFTNRTVPGRVSSVHDLSLVAVVDDDGLVRSLDLQYAGTLEGEAVRVRHTIRYAAVGTTAVDRPPWFDRAASCTAPSG